MELQGQYKRLTEDIDGINEDLSELGKNQMHAEDSDSEDEGAGEQNQLLLDAQAGHFGHFAQRQAEGQQKGTDWLEGDAQADADMPGAEDLRGVSDLTNRPPGAHCGFVAGALGKTKVISLNLTSLRPGATTLVALTQL
eukprot:16430160-Heterocapsa_arctica.AAC.1